MPKTLLQVYMPNGIFSRPPLVPPEAAVKTQLSPSDYDQVLACIENVHKCRSLEEYPPLVLREMGKLIESNLAAYNEVNLVRDRVVVLFDRPSQQFNPLLEKFGSLVHEHPVVSYFNSTGDGQALKISDFMSAREFHRLNVYREVYRHIGAEDQISIGVRLAHNFIIGLAFNRSGRTFTERDRLKLNLVRPHIVQAYLHAEERAGYQEKQRDLHKALSATGLGLISLNAAGRVMSATPGAFERLADYLPLPAPGHGSLPEALENWAFSTGGQEEPFVVSHENRRLIIRRTRQDSRLLLLLNEENISAAVERLARFQLTPREGEVLRWITESKSNAEIATILGLTPGTVKVHVERILAKLGVENRTAAALAVRSLNF